jgi:heme A synthase
VSLFLRIAAVFALLRAVGLACFQSVVLGEFAGRPVLIALANGLALANLGLAYVLWRAARNPRGERTGIYVALLLVGGRAVTGTYEVLYLLDGSAAVVSLIDMIASLALFIGILNTLPAVLRNAESGMRSAE